MSGVGRGVLFLGLIAVLAGCSEPVDGTGTIAADVYVPASGPAPTTTAKAAPRPSPSATPVKRDPLTTANRVNVRPGDLGGSWRPIPGSGERGNDSFDWVILCARDASVPPGTFSGAATPDFSPTGTAYSSQVGSVTGLFPTDAAAHAFVALFRMPAFGACLAAEATRRWPQFRSVPAFGRRAYRVATATEAALMDSRTRLTDGAALHLQFLPIRTGPIVTVLSTAWRPGADDQVVLRAATNIGHRQHTA